MHDFHLETLDAGGLRWGALVSGGEGPLALLLHGFPDDPGSWAPVASRLVAAGHRVVAPWLPGYGPTEPPPDADYQLPALAARLCALIPACGAESALVVGHDWGAALAYQMAIDAPARVSRVLGLSVPPIGMLLRNLRRDPAQLGRSAYMARFQLPGTEARLRAGGYAAIHTLWRTWSPTWSPPPGRVEAVITTLDTGASLSHALAYYRALGRDLCVRPRAWSRALARVLRPIPVPTTVLAGADDGCMGPALYRVIPDGVFRGPARVTIVPAAGHFLPLEAPDAIAAAALGHPPS